MAKKIISALMAVVLSLSVAACGSSNTTSSTGSEASASTGESTTESTETAETDLKEEELVTLDVITMSSGKEDKDVKLVEAEMNKILEEKFNCNVKLTFLPYATYAEQVTLMLASGEGADILPVYMIPLPTCANAG